MKHKKVNKYSIAAVLTAVFFVLGPAAEAMAATPVDLGTAKSFAVLAGTPNITNVPTSVITGDVGLSPASGAGIGLTAAQVTGTIYSVDSFGPSGSVTNPALLTSAKNDLTAAYIDAAGRTPVTILPTELGSTVVTPGVYASNAGTFQVTGTLTLNAQNDPNAVFIFQMSSTLTTASASSVVLENGAQACNVFWQVGSSIGNLGTNSTFVGNILALTSLSLNTGVHLTGRVLARNGAVTLDSDTITVPACTVATTTSTTTTTPTLPNTGLGPKNTTGNSWNILIPAGIFIAASSLLIIRKKRTV